MIDLFYDVVHRVLLIRYGGSLSVADLAELDRVAKSFVALRGRVPGIVDVSGVTEVNVPTVTIRTLGGMRPVMEDEWRVYVAPTPETYGLLQIYAAEQERAGFKPPVLVRTMEEAQRFLKIDKPFFTPYLELSEGPAY